MATENIYEDLRNRLISNEFQPGQRLSPETLRHHYQVSANTIRELLFRLSTVGLVNFLEQRGFRMPQQSAELQHDLTQTRIMLECEGSCLSIRHGGVAWEARLSAAHHELKHIETRIHSNTKNAATTQVPMEFLALWADAELKFHRTLIEECRSPLLQEFHMQIYHRFRQQMIIYDKDYTYIALNVNQHQDILEAVLQRDEDLVRQRIVTHLSRHLSHPLPEKVARLGS